MSTFDGRLPANVRCGTSDGARPLGRDLLGRLPERERLGLREHVRDEQVVVPAERVEARARSR